MRGRGWGTATYVCVGTLIRTGARERDKLMAPLVHHETANCRERGRDREREKKSESTWFVLLYHSFSRSKLAWSLARHTTDTTKSRAGEKQCLAKHLSRWLVQPMAAKVLYCTTTSSLSRRPYGRTQTHTMARHRAPHSHSLIEYTQCLATLAPHWKPSWAQTLGDNGGGGAECIGCLNNR